MQTLGIKGDSDPLVQKEAKRPISFAYQNKDKERDCYSYVNLAAEQNGKELNKLKDGGCWNKCM